MSVRSEVPDCSTLSDRENYIQSLEADQNKSLNILLSNLHERGGCVSGDGSTVSS